MIKKEGKIPVNARVDIDYSGKTPKIKFGYTSNNPKKDAMKQHSWGLHTLILVLIFYFAFGFFATQSVIKGDYPESCSVEFNKIDETLNYSIDFERGESYKTTIINRTYKKVITGANITCDGKIYPIKFRKDISLILLASEEKGFYHEYSERISSFMVILYLFSILFLFIIAFIYLNKLVTYLLLKSKKYQKGFPKFNARIIKSRKYMKFRPRDVENNMVEIPSFSNVELNYKTHGDFSEQLQRLKIREHTHYKYKKGRKGKLKRDEFKWYARFFFKETPKDGYLEVVYH